MLGQESNRGGLEDGPVRIASSTRSEVGHWPCTSIGGQKPSVTST